HVVSSFIPDVVLELKTRSAAIPLGIICEKRAQLARWPGLPVEYVIAHESLVDEHLIAEVRKARRRLFIWTVNDRNNMLRAAKWGVEGRSEERRVGKEGSTGWGEGHVYRHVV